MPVIKFTEIRELYHRGKDRKGTTVDTLVIHGTAGGGAGGKIGAPGGLLRWMLGGERQTEYERAVGLFHYLCERDGDCFEIIDPENFTYHAGIGTRRDTTEMQTIGIELVNRDTNNMGEYTPYQYEALKSLLSLLFNKYPIKEILDRRVQ